MKSSFSLKQSVLEQKGLIFHKELPVFYHRALKSFSFFFFFEVNLGISLTNGQKYRRWYDLLL
jgi:hypothetical protein